MKEFLAVGFFILVIALIIFMPFAWIWSVNTLFGFSIAYTFKTWLASFLLGGLIGSSAYRGSSK